VISENEFYMKKKYLSNAVSFICFFLRQHMQLWVVCFCSNVIIAMINAIIPYTIKLTIDCFTNGINFSLPIICLFGLKLLADCISIASGYYMSSNIPFFRRDVALALQTHTNKIDYQFFKKNTTGSISNKIIQIPKSTENIISTFLQMIINPTIYLVVSMLILYEVGFLFSLLVCLLLIAQLSLNFLLKGKISKSFLNYAEFNSNVSGHITDSIDNILNVKLFNGYDKEKKHLLNLYCNEIKLARKSNLMMESLYAFQRIIFYVYFLLNVFLVLHKWKSNLVTIGDVSLIFITTMQIMSNLWSINYIVNIFYREGGKINSVLTFFRESFLERKQGAKSVNNKKGNINFENVIFQYNSKKIIDNLSFSIISGEKVLLSGPSGIGKTTVLHLLTGLYAPSFGNIYVNGIEIKKILPQILREMIAFVPQDHLLFARSLLDNIKYGNPNATFDEIIRVSKLANCSSFINKLEKKYDTIMKGQKKLLSGGEAQRINIARALLKPSPILILDESFSFLDNNNEQEILKEILNLNKTIIIVSHKIKKIELFDKIIKLT
jgi:ATP-binding cassette, subfamily B, bacterial